jgi:hypothetical protein
MSYQPTQLEQAVYKWLDKTTSTSSEVTVIYGNQRAPRPETPFVTLVPIRDDGVQMKPNWKLTDTAGGNGDFVGEMDTEREITFSIQAFGKDCYDICRRVTERAARPDILAVLNDNGLAYRRMGQVTKLFDELSTDIEPRATVEATFGYRYHEEFSYPAVERVIATGEDGLDNIDLNEVL